MNSTQQELEELSKIVDRFIGHIFDWVGVLEHTELLRVCYDFQAAIKQKMVEDSK